MSTVPDWAKGLIRYFCIFHYRFLCSNPLFQNPEKLLEGEDIFSRPKCGSGFLRYWAMVNSLGVRFLENTNLVLSTKKSNF